MEHGQWHEYEETEEAIDCLQPRTCVAVCHLSRISLTVNSRWSCHFYIPVKFVTTTFQCPLTSVENRSISFRHIISCFQYLVFSCLRPEIRASM